MGRHVAGQSDSAPMSEPGGKSGFLARRRTGDPMSRHWFNPSRFPGQQRHSPALLALTQ